MTIYLPLAFTIWITTLLFGIILAIFLIRSVLISASQEDEKMLNKFTGEQLEEYRTRLTVKVLSKIATIVIITIMSQYFLLKTFESGITTNENYTLYKTVNNWGMPYRYHISTTNEEQVWDHNKREYVDKTYTQFEDHQFDTLYKKYFSDVDINDVYYKVNLNVKMENN